MIIAYVQVRRMNKWSLAIAVLLIWGVCLVTEPTGRHSASLHSGVLGLILSQEVDWLAYVFCA